MTSTEHLSRLALVSLPSLGPLRARWLLGGGSAADVLDELRAGRLPVTLGPRPPGVTADLVTRWQAAALKVDLRSAAEGIERHRITLLGPDDPAWPFVDDPDPPVLVLSQGDPALIGRRPAVGIVGTRQCTSIGREVAIRLGRELAEANVVVVSGLAAGIDGAAHRGALQVGGPVVGVVGTGLDVIYPRVNESLWQQVRSQGALLTEAALGARATRWRFPARNRLIAALVDVLVVVESHRSGGSLSTATEAADRGRTVMAVPGSVLSPASEGTNRLLADGCPPACGADDVLLALELDGARAPEPSDHGSPSDVMEPVLGPLEARIVEEVAAGACHLDRLVEATHSPITEVLAAVRQLDTRRVVTLEGSTVCLRGDGWQPTFWES